MTPPLGVYLHVPYCASICSYCDFTKYVAGDRAGWAQTAIAELRLAVRALGDRARPAETVFFGGGTPTVLPAADLGAVLRAVRDELGIAPGAEITVEANPDSVDERYLAELRAAGANRVSIGMQSAAPHVLELLGRTHAAHRPPQAAREARAAGFEQVSLDLIYGATNETDADWRTSVEAAIGAGPDHVSAYGLTLEPGTRLHARVARGELPVPDPDALADRYLLADELLTAAGLGWYEVSNWARDDESRCRHNSACGRAASGSASGRAPTAASAAGGAGTSGCRRCGPRASPPASFLRRAARTSTPSSAGSSSSWSPCAPATASRSATRPCRSRATGSSSSTAAARSSRSAGGCSPIT